LRTLSDMRPIVRVQNITKQYRIGGLPSGYLTFREMAGQWILQPFRLIKPEPKTDENLVWALKEINFDIRPGELVGLIGHNGAGKSTLLKILSRIVEPTSGGFELYGRVGSLLEVGTGFHPDLTGKENVYLSGAILGIRKAELERKFDEIVEFSGIEKYINTPVKYYSTGMYLRLAFSVAVHVDTEILFMDEVLAVGDIPFQQKCLKKMYDIRQEGRTIIFVSHDMEAVKRVCKRAIWINKGQIEADGTVDSVVGDYLRSIYN
jgi:lipopolysaccharide transport system ATP-binding protein